LTFLLLLVQARRSQSPLEGSDDPASDDSESPSTVSSGQRRRKHARSATPDSFPHYGSESEAESVASVQSNASVQRIPRERDTISEDELNFSSSDEEWEEVVDVNEKNVFTWHEGPHSTEPKQFKEPEERWNIDFSEETPVLELFRHFLTDEILNVIVEETNKYAAEKIANASDADMDLSQRLQQWVPVTPADILRFLAVKIQMDLKKMPDMTDSWSTDPQFGDPFIQRIMSRDRFQAIARMIHYSDNSLDDKSDR